MNTKTKGLQTDLTDNPVISYLNSLTSKSSKRTMLSALKSVYALALGEAPEAINPEDVIAWPWGGIDPGKLKAIRAALVERYSPAMAGKSFAAVRGVLGACFDQKLIDAETWMRLQRVKGIRVSQDQVTGRCLTEGEVMSLARVCFEDKSPAGARDDAIIGLGVTQGPRVSEYAGFELSDYNQDTGDLIIRKGKGGKTRTIRASNSTKDSLDEWLRFRGDKPGSLFCAVNKVGDVQITGLTQQALSKILHKRAAQAGVKRFGAHDLRRTFITNGWRIGIPGTQLQRLAGHSSLATTANYDRGDLEEALQSSERLHYPSMRNAA